MSKPRYFLTIALCFLSIPFLVAQASMMKGVYGHPQSLWDKGYVLSELGVNAVFIRSHSIDSATVNRAREDGLKVYAEFATLNGKSYVKEHPEAHAINDKGAKVEPASWFMGVCPNNEKFLEYRLDQLRSLLSKYDLDGVWLDYVHWHAQFEEKEPILPETCFCPDCRAAFSDHASLEIPDATIADQAQWILTNHDSAWRTWRCNVIVDWIEGCREVIEELRPSALLGVYHCPWNDDEHDKAQRRILGLDFDLLAPVVDVFSPMVYHGRMQRTAEWVGSNINWLGERIDSDSSDAPLIWPIVQAHEVSVNDFATVMKAGLEMPSSGVMMFTASSVASDPKKVAAMKKIFADND